MVARARPHHPYAVFGAELPALIARTRRFLTETHAALGLTGATDRNLLLATPFGSLKEAWLAQGSIARGDLRTWTDASIGVVAIPNRTAFDASATAAGLTAAGFRAIALAVDVPVHAFASLPELTKALDQSFVKAVAAAAKKAGVTHLLLPTAGMTDPSGLLDALVREGISAAAELMGTPPSVPGLRLEQDFQSQLETAGVTVIKGSVREAVRTRGRVERLVLDDGRELEADALVLASGRFLGGGIRHEGVFRETVFGLPVFVEGVDVADKWLGELLDRNAAGTQTALKAGVAVDSSLRPIDDQGRVVFENLFAAGSVIGGYDPSKDGTGLGVAALTALVAGESAAQLRARKPALGSSSRTLNSSAAEESRP
jgi:glycerol-3-phosphate dehydrogenase subunit B